MSKTFKILILVLAVGGIVFAFDLNRGAAQLELPLSVKKEKPLKAPRALYVLDEIIVKFKPGINENAIKGLQQAQSVLEKHISPFGKFKILKIPQNKSVSEMVKVFKKSPLVEYAEPNYYAYSTMVPNDPAYPYQWHLDNTTYGGIQMEQAWDTETGDTSIIVAVVDTGVAYENYPAPAHWHIDSYNAYGGSGNSWWCGLNNPNWATPPGYGNGWKNYLQHSFDLTGAVGTVTFSYYYKYDIERNYDFFYVDVSDDGGDTWTTLKTYTNNAGGGGYGGRSVNWTQDSVNLTTYKGKSILIRFRFNSDDTYSDEDGLFNSEGAVYIDEIKLEDDSGTLFYDDAESGAGTWETTQYEQAPDLASTSFATGYDFVNNDTHPNDDEGHGTHVAGTIAQTTNNSLGVAGIAFDTTLMPVKVLNAAGSGTYQQITDGIYYAVNNGAKVINMSLGGSSPASILETAVTYAYNSGVTVLAACGNSGISTCDYPAAYNSYVIAIGATQYDETKAPYSSYGSSLDITAPGGNTSVDQNSDGYVDGVLQQTFSDTPVDWSYWFYQGTSMATPHVSGVTALLLALKSTLTPTEIRSALESTAEDKGAAGWDSTYGWGIVDAEAALASIPAVSITITTDGSVDFGIMALGDAQDTTPSGTNDVQTVRIDTGPANLDVKSSVFSNGNTWSLGAGNGVNQVKWEFATSTGSSWNTFLASDTVYDLADNIAQNSTQDLYLKITMPTESSSSTQHSATVTIVATAP